MALPTQAPVDDERRRAERLTGAVVGTIVAAGMLAVSAAEDRPHAFEAGVYMVATVFVFWLAHGWARSLGQRVLGAESGLLTGLRHELPVLESAAAPVLALAIVAALGESDETAITIAAWVCVAELGLLGAGIARREGASAVRITLTGAGCAALGLAMIVLKALVH